MAKGRPTNDPKRTTLNVRVAVDDKSALETLATRSGKTVSALVQEVIRQYLRNALPLPNPTLYNPLTDLLTPSLTHAKETHDHIPPPGTTTDSVNGTDPSS